MRYTLIALFACLLFSLSILATERYYFTNLSLKDGLSQITVTCIYQDKKGFMWFGTRNGLNRYDGYKFDTYILHPGNDSSISDNHVFCITEDNEGNLWVGTNHGLNKLDLSTGRVQQYYSEEGNAKSLSNNMVLSLCSDEKGNIWVGTGSGLNRYESNTDSFVRIGQNGILQKNPVYGLAYKNGKLYLGTHLHGLVEYQISEEKLSELQGTPVHIRSVFVDHFDNLWIGTQDRGVFLLKKNSSDFIVCNTGNGLTNNYVRSIAESPDGNTVLVGTFNGLNVIDIKTGQIEQYKDYDSENGKLSHYSIFSLYFDRSQTLWVGTYAGGIDYHSAYGERFRYYNPAQKTKAITGIIGPMVETEDFLYIATEGSGLLEMDKKTEGYKIYRLYDDRDGAYARNILKSLYLDGDKILCGTNAGTIYSFDLKTRRFSLFHDFKSQNGIYYIGRNRQGDIVAGGVNQIGLVFFSGGKVRDSFPLKDGKQVSIPNIRCVLEIAKDVYLIGSRNDGLYYYDMNTGDLKQYTASSSSVQENCLPENYITSIYKDTTGNIWIGTFGGGFCLFDLEAGTFKTYNTSDGLLDNNVCTIIENNHELWISTISGITDFDLIHKSFKNYTYSSGISVNEFTPHAGIRLSDNRIMFSGNNGFLSFEPDKISYNPYVPPVILENLYVNNEVVPVGGHILQKLLEGQQELTLKYNETNIAIEYSALNYIFSNKNEYAYKLEGFDADWNNVGTRRIAYYTNIPPGEYRFVVRGTNNDGVWNNEGASVSITVLPPLWKTWWAYTLYILFAVGVIAFIYRYFSEKKRLQNDIKLRQAEAKAQAEFHEERNKLFTNFSHELRTPLTLILSPLEDMMEKPELVPQPMENKIHLMRSNAQRLLRLVNNLMDFQKQESGTMKLRVSEGDFVEFTEEMIVLFKELAASRGISFTFQHSVDSIDYWFDTNLMEKVYFNFLSNAFKNVPNGGAVNVGLEIVPLDTLKQRIPVKAVGFDNAGIRYILLRIDDTGAGIAGSELEKIFAPFYQVAQNEHSASGTGLGLSLSKSIIEMHHGVIWAESVVGQGASFRCILPVDKSLYSDEDFDDVKREDKPASTIEVRGTSEKVEETDTRKLYSILVVEDNPDVRNYIISHLREEYNIQFAADGAEAIDKAVKHLPDLIISDVMMPKMDGMEMAATLKGDLRTGHIPIIMITAKAMPDDMKEGYNVGADDYITKPFNASVLVARVRNIIRSRESLKEIYGKRFSLESLGVETTSADDRFMQKLYDAIEKNVSNPELNLDSFSKEIGMSKANLYRKIKMLTNLSPTEFIRNFRLEMAAKIMNETRLSVSEVYVAVGFSSHAYFSNCFKALYGISPTEYMNRISEGK
ncbi:hybrid sensor histidine kinase/response regulator transcription factor [Dysgonomonas sp. 511]|uniref:hybrid sensor histidine kinase/response regulator transcription factor n=1 Tax=Dysgonomonas sp. 511 TaxID=2302930 RepID=UPI0013D2D612|nr:hybrid sensor histidine kinase/response regulator transcription factor [Dysgonomonas sp. 511]NDV78895.1 hybrid sensor histidine kinase/response regulator [Dysgonomonas sp. 511]